MYFSLTIRNIRNLKEYNKLLSSINKFDLINYVFDDGKYEPENHQAVFSSWDEQKWERHYGQMIILSEEHPTMTFELTCQDGIMFWKEYYKDGTEENCSGDVVFEVPKKIKWDSLVNF